MSVKTATHISEKMGEIYSTYATSEAVRAGDHLHIGGIVAFDDEGSVIAPEDGKTQAEIIYGRIKQLLEANGATADNVVSETICITNWEQFEEGAGVRKQFYDEVNAVYPSCLGYQVKSLAAPGLVMEVQLVAYIGSK